MTALPSWPQIPDGFVRARELEVGSRVLLGDTEAEVLAVELRHYYDGGSLVIPSEARIIIELVNVYGDEATLELGLLDPIKLIE